MKRGKLLLSVVLLVVLFTVPLMQAFTTDIEIKTHADHNVSVSIIDPEEKDSREHFMGNSGSDGKYLVKYDAGTTLEFALIFVVSKDKRFVVRPTTFGNYTPGGKLEFELLSNSVRQIIEEPEPIKNLTDEVNQTLEENATIENVSSEAEVIENKEDGGLGITGSAVSEPEGEGFLSAKIIYSIIAMVVVLGGFIGLAVMRKKSKTSIPNEINVKKLSEVKANIKSENKEDLEEVKEKVQQHKDTIEDAERKLKEAQEEIGRLRDKKKDKIDEAKKKLIEDEERLMRLRRGEDV